MVFGMWGYSTYSTTCITKITCKVRLISIKKSTFGLHNAHIRKKWLNIEDIWTWIPEKNLHILYVMWIVFKPITSADGFYSWCAFLVICFTWWVTTIKLTEPYRILRTLKENSCFHPLTSKPYILLWKKSWNYTYFWVI